MGVWSSRSGKSVLWRLVQILSWGKNLWWTLVRKDTCSFGRVERRPGKEYRRFLAVFQPGTDMFPIQVRHLCAHVRLSRRPLLQQLRRCSQNCKRGENGETTGKGYWRSLQWTPIPASVGIAFICFIHFRRIQNRRYVQEHPDELVVDSWLVSGPEAMAFFVILFYFSKRLFFEAILEALSKTRRVWWCASIQSYLMCTFFGRTKFSYFSLQIFCAHWISRFGQFIKKSKQFVVQIH